MYSLHSVAQERQEEKHAEVEAQGGITVGGRILPLPWLPQGQRWPCH